MTFSLEAEDVNVELVFKKIIHLSKIASGIKLYNTNR